MPPVIDDPVIGAILLDIEGTTTPVSFVHQTLFPWARAQMRTFLLKHHDEPSIRADIERLRAEHAGETLPVPEWHDGTPEQRMESAAAYALWLMDRDRKSTGLKSLQGKIWEAGYLSGKLRGEVYSDVPPALARWNRQGRRIAIFSSGSVLAQKLLFGHSTAGDLTAHLHSYFDTTIGSKQDSASYRRIAERLAVASGRILFLSDTIGELDAAGTGGLRTAICFREDSPRANSNGHLLIRTFEDVFP